MSQVKERPKCRHFSFEEFNRYQLNLLRNRERSRVRRHLAKCGDCQKRLEAVRAEWKELDQALQAIEHKPVGLPRWKGRLGEGLPDPRPDPWWERFRQDLRRWLRTPPVLTVASAAAVALILAIILPGTLVLPPTNGTYFLQVSKRNDGDTLEIVDPPAELELQMRAPEGRSYQCGLQTAPSGTWTPFAGVEPQAITSDSSNTVAVIVERSALQETALYRLYCEPLIGDTVFSQTFRITPTQ